MYRDCIQVFHGASTIAPNPSFRTVINPADARELVGLTTHLIRRLQYVTKVSANIQTTTEGISISTVAGSWHHRLKCQQSTFVTALFCTIPTTTTTTIIMFAHQRNHQSIHPDFFKVASWWEWQLQLSAVPQMPNMLRSRCNRMSWWTQSNHMSSHFLGIYCSNVRQHYIAVSALWWSLYADCAVASLRLCHELCEHDTFINLLFHSCAHYNNTK